MDLTLISLWIHIPAVTSWIGLVMFDVFAVAAPGLALPQRARLIMWSRPYVIVAIVLIMITGIRQTMDNPFLQVDSWDTLEQLRDRTYGLALFWKHGCVLVTFALTIAVRFFYGPRLGVDPLTAVEGPAPAVAVSAKRMVLWLSVLNLAVCCGALILATVMVWQLH